MFNSQFQANSAILKLSTPADLPENKRWVFAINIKTSYRSVSIPVGEVVKHKTDKAYLTKSQADSSLNAVTDNYMKAVVKLIPAFESVSENSATQIAEALSGVDLEFSGKVIRLSELSHDTVTLHFVESQQSTKVSLMVFVKNYLVGNVKVL